MDGRKKGSLISFFSKKTAYMVLGVVAVSGSVAMSMQLECSKGHGMLELYIFRMWPSRGGVIAEAIATTSNDTCTLIACSGVAR